MVPPMMMMVPVMMVARSHVNVGNELMMVTSLVVVVVMSPMVVMLHLQRAVNCGDRRRRKWRGLAR